MDVSTPPSLDLACPQAKAKIEKYVHIFREQFLLLATMTTCLKDLTQSIGRYGGLSWQN